MIDVMVNGLVGGLLVINSVICLVINLVLYKKEQIIIDNTQLKNTVPFSYSIVGLVTGIMLITIAAISYFQRT